MDCDAALLVAPTPDAMAAGMLKLLKNDSLRHELGLKSKKLAQERYSMNAFKAVVNRLYDYIESLSGNTPDNSTNSGHIK
jgi:glycosyltransferase involved in cell wall biosynthesis